MERGPHRVTAEHGKVVVRSKTAGVAKDLRIGDDKGSWSLLKSDGKQGEGVGRGGVVGSGTGHLDIW